MYLSIYLSPPRPRLQGCSRAANTEPSTIEGHVLQRGGASGRLAYRGHRGSAISLASELSTRRCGATHHRQLSQTALVSPGPMPLVRRRWFFVTPIRRGLVAPGPSPALHARGRGVATPSSSSCSRCSSHGEPYGHANRDRGIPSASPRRPIGPRQSLRPSVMR